MNKDKAKTTNSQLMLPEAPDFISKPPQYTLAEMIKLSESLLPYWNKKRYEPGSPYLLKVEMSEFVL